jgi:hypothetical protein
MNLQQAKESVSNGGFFRNWMPALQRLALLQALKSEEKMGFVETLTELRQRIETMPKTYETDGQGKYALVQLHYFQAGMDFHVTEKDTAGDDDQQQAFGLSDLGFGAELGYINIQELVENGIELDLYWSLKKLGEVQK